MRPVRCLCGAVCLWFGALLPAQGARAADTASNDPYETYVRTSSDFRPVDQRPQRLLEAFPSWTYMPWTFRWGIGYTAASGKWSRESGYNGAFFDRGEIADGASATGKLDWVNANRLRFYVDHLAGKGDLHLWDGNDLKPHAAALHGTGVRTVPVNAKLAEKLHRLIREHIAPVQGSPFRAAYALDDELSWGHFVHPAMWRVTDDPEAYPRWLSQIYGPSAPQRDRWVSYDDLRPSLKKWDVAHFNASPLLDQWTFNDSVWANFLGDLVEYTNSIDPRTPCGFVGGQCPSPFGGYDYARLMRKVQFVEAYNLGSSQAIIRSFNPRNALPTVTTHFHQSVADDIWQAWYYLAHGNRGMIGWVDGWFDGKTPKPWHTQVAPNFLEIAEKVGPKMEGAQWAGDGVYLYYSHPSIQLGWVMDAEAHGKTWVSRNGDDKLGASHQVRHAWLNMLADEGFRPSFVSYIDVVQKGLPADCRVLILPACLCLSTAEAARIDAFCKAGGTVIADYLPGLWDQHGKGYAAGGVLDPLFGVHHDPSLKAADLFNGPDHPLWCEIDQDANFTYPNYQTFLTNHNTCIRDASGFNKAVRNMGVGHVARYGAGQAVMMNLSPQWYNAYRSQGAEAAQRRSIFMKPVSDAVGQPWAAVVATKGAAFGAELTCWDKAGRRTLFVCQNPEVVGTQTGGGNAAGLKTDRIPITVHFAQPRPTSATSDPAACWATVPISPWTGS